MSPESEMKIGALAPKKKRKKPFSATKHAIGDFKALDFSYWCVEQQIPYSFIKRDCFGFGDYLIHRPGFGIALVQVTSGDNHSLRRTKLLSEDIAPRVAAWLASGGRVEIWSYRLAGARGARKVYALRREEIKTDDLPAIFQPLTLTAGEAVSVSVERELEA